MTFDDWYEQYERDGGELMLFNTIDLHAAFMAGEDAANTLPHRAMFDEGICVGKIMAAKECAEIAYTTEPPKSIGRQMGRHHSAGAQHAAQRIRDKFKLSR